MRADDFHRLFEAYHGAVLGYGLRRVDPATAHDVAAETFAVAWRRLAEPPEVPLPWLLAVARRILANEVRGTQQRDRLARRVASDRSRPPHATDLTEAPSELADDVAAALARLSPDDQEVIRLVAWDELDHADAAAVLGCSAAAFRVRLHRARRRLRAAMARPPDRARSVFTAAAAAEPAAPETTVPLPTTTLRGGT